jgi:general stress protein 26
MSSSHTTTTTSSLLPAALFVIPALAVFFRNIIIRRQRALDDESLRGHCETSSIDPLHPPFPLVVQKLLQSSRLAYLSTFDADAGTSHLCLMRFTYFSSEEVIIMSTNRYTKKYEMLKKQRGVAVLVHDFGGGDNTNGNHSITLNGTCSIIEDVERMERYRKAHLAQNPDYPQFIVGEEIAILVVDVRTARICNIEDRVIQWNVGDAK